MGTDATARPFRKDRQAPPENSISAHAGRKVGAAYVLAAASWARGAG